MDRISRSTYIISSVIITILNLIIYIYFDFNNEEDLSFISLYSFIVFIISFILNIGRLNDINMSGWYSLLALIPIINIGFISLFFIDGTVGNNKYGKDPKGRLKEKQTNQNFNERKTETIKNVSKRLKLLEESLQEGLLNKEEFAIKKQLLQEEKEKILTKIQNDESRTKKIKKLKELLENNIISETEYNNKVNKLNSQNINDIFHINLNTKLFYVSKGKEFGPYPVKKIISLLKNKEINPNCYIRFQNNKEYSNKAFELLDNIDN